MATQVLKIYGDRLSQPVRAVIIFCKVNGIKFEEVEIKLPTANIQNPEFQAINPLKKVPAIAHGDFALFESHAILTYLAGWYQVPDHWYPADLRKRAKIQSVLDWHHSTLRYGATNYLESTILAPFFGRTPNAEVAAECEQKVIESCSAIETLWLQGDSKFLLGNDKPSLADLSLVCEIMELHMLSDEEWNRMIGPFKKVQQWIENVKQATNPHFDEVHQLLFDATASSKQKMATEVLKLYGDRNRKQRQKWLPNRNIHKNKQNHAVLKQIYIKMRAIMRQVTTGKKHHFNAVIVHTTKLSKKGVAEGSSEAEMTGCLPKFQVMLDFGKGIAKHQCSPRRC